MFQFTSGEEGFGGVGFESGFPESTTDAFEFFQMLVEGSLGKAQEVVNVRSHMTESFEEFIHLFLEDVRIVAWAHRDALTFAFPKWQCNGAEFSGTSHLIPDG